MKCCAVCGAPAEPTNEDCPFAVPEELAPWRGDYGAMSRGEMTHAEHQVQVARWALHNTNTQSQKSLAVLRAIAQAHTGQFIEIFDSAEQASGP